MTLEYQCLCAEGFADQCPCNTKGDTMTVIEHWFCPGCGEIDGPRAGMTCHGPDFTGGCASVGNEVVEISHDAAERLRGP